jgi:hypothetical protein
MNGARMLAGGIAFLVVLFFLTPFLSLQAGVQ